jgi:hypothetical protein
VAHALGLALRSGLLSSRMVTIKIAHAPGYGARMRVCGSAFQVTTCRDLSALRRGQPWAWARSDIVPLGLLVFDVISMPLLTIIRGRSDPGCCVIHSCPDAAKPHSSIKVVSPVEPSIAWPALA